MDWIVLIFTIALLALFPTLSTQRSRQVIFLTLYVIGAAAATYGFLLFTQMKDKEYFRAAGLPLSLVIVTVLCFAALTLERTFNYSQLRKWGYPSVCLWLIIWLGATTAVETWYVFYVRDKLVQPIALTFFGVVGIDPTTMEFKILNYWAWISTVSLLVALLISLVWRFNLRLFQVLFPVCSCSLLISIAVHYHYYTAGVIPSGLSAIQTQALITDPVSVLRYVFFIYIWTFFFVIAYFYLNAKFHAERLHKYAFIRKLPNAAVFLVTISFFHAFPKFDRLRDAFPKISEIYETVLTISDIVLIIVMTVIAISGRLLRPTPMRQSQKGHEWI